MIENVKQITLYGDPTATSPELQRLIAMRSFPSQVSIDLLSDVAGLTVVDVGSGPSTELEAHVRKCSGANYFAIDLLWPMLEARHNSNEFASASPRIQADTLHLPVADNSADIVHARFLLSHLHREDWMTAISEYFRILRKDGTIFLLDHDWRTLQSSLNQPAIDELMVLMVEYAEIMHINLYAGEAIEHIAPAEFSAATDTDLDIRVSRRARPEGEYSNELLAITSSAVQRSTSDAHKARVAAQKVKREGNTMESEQLSQLAERLETLAGKLKKMLERIKENPFSFVPPDIVVMTISRKT